MAFSDSYSLSKYSCLLGSAFFCSSVSLEHFFNPAIRVCNVFIKSLSFCSNIFLNPCFASVSLYNPSLPLSNKSFTHSGYFAAGSSKVLSFKYNSVYLFFICSNPSLSFSLSLIQ